MLHTMVGMAAESAPAAAADALARRPSASSLRQLMQLAGNPNRDAKYAATLALVRSRSADALPVLRSVATDPGAGASRLFAHIGLAAAGDAESLKAVNDALPFMKGRDLLESGRAL